MDDIEVINDKSYKTTYNKVSIEASKGGWIVTQKGKAPEVFTNWKRVIARIERELTTGAV